MRRERISARDVRTHQSTLAATKKQIAEEWNIRAHSDSGRQGVEKSVSYAGGQNKRKQIHSTILELLESIIFERITQEHVEASEGSGGSRVASSMTSTAEGRLDIRLRYVQV